MRFVTTIFVLISVASSLSCSKTNSPQQAQSPMGLAQAKEALKDLRKVQAAVSVGTNQINYDPLLIQAKSSCEEAKRKLPGGALKTEIDQAIKAYADAGMLWSKWRDIMPDSPPYQAWKAKYGIKSHSKKLTEPMPMTVVSFDPDESVPVIWSYAAKHVEEISRLVDEIDAAQQLN